MLSGLDLLSAVTPRGGYRVERGVRYGERPEQLLDIYRPAEPRAAARPILFFHGGSWSSGRRGEYRFVGQAFASAGYVVAIPDYRVYPTVVFPAFVEDGARAVAWALGALSSKGDSPVLVGHSAGAHIAALLALDRRYLEAAGVAADRVDTVVGLSGPYDFLPLTKPLFKAIFPEPTRAESQPINYAAGGAGKRLLLLAGAEDRTAEPGNSLRLARGVEAAGGEAETILYPRVGHLGPLLALAAALPLRKPPIRADILRFLARRGE